MSDLDDIRAAVKIARPSRRRMSRGWKVITGITIILVAAGHVTLYELYSEGMLHGRGGRAQATPDGGASGGVPAPRVVPAGGTTPRPKSPAVAVVGGSVARQVQPASRPSALSVPAADRAEPGTQPTVVAVKPDAPTTSPAPSTPAISLASLTRDGAFGFPQAKARILCDNRDLRVSVWSNDRNLFVQAIVWADDADGVVEKMYGGGKFSVSDWGVLGVHVTDTPQRAAKADRFYHLNPFPSTQGLWYEVVLGERTTTGLENDSDGRGAILFPELEGGMHVRVDNFSIPLDEIKKRPGDEVRLAYWAVSPKRDLTVNSVGSTQPEARHYTSLPLEKYHVVALAKGNSPFDSKQIPETRATVAGGVKGAGLEPVPSAGQTWTNSLGMTFAYIPEGEFLMGTPETELHRAPQETQHKVRLTKPFMMAVTTVTQTQWKAVMGTDPSQAKGDDLPVENVSWNDADAFCRRLSKKEGRRYDLPTEAQWEYACRAGTTGPFGGTGDIEEMGWYADNSGDSRIDSEANQKTGFFRQQGQRTHPVMLKKPNAWGLYDMHGNVFQWCRDVYAAYPVGDVVDPLGPEAQASTTDQHRILRGGCYANHPNTCRSGLRGWEKPFSTGVFGFRVCLLSPPPALAQRPLVARGVDVVVRTIPSVSTNAPPAQATAHEASSPTTPPQPTPAQKSVEVLEAKLTATLRDHTNTVHAVALSRGGELIVTGGWDEKCIGYHLEGPNPKKIVTAQQRFGVDALKVWMDGNTPRGLFTASRTTFGNVGGSIRWTSADGTQSRELAAGPGDGFHCLDIAPPGLLAVGGGSGRVCVFDITGLDKPPLPRDLESIEVKPVAPPLLSNVMAVAFRAAPTAAKLSRGPLLYDLFVGCSDGSIHLFHVGAAGVNPVALAFEGHKRPVRALISLPRSDVLISASLDGTIRFWNAITGSEDASRRISSTAATALALSPDGRFLLTAHEDHRVRGWAITTGAAAMDLDVGQMPVQCLDIIATAKPLPWRLAAGGDDMAARIWDVSVQSKRAAMPPMGGGSTSPQSSAQAPPQAVPQLP